jgi:hypothetical protein
MAEEPAAAQTMAEELKAEFLRLKDHGAVDTVAAKLPPGRKNVSVGGNLDARQKSLLLMAKGNCARTAAMEAPGRTSLCFIWGEAGVQELP